jgi:hypothetical protein
VQAAGDRWRSQKKIDRFTKAVENGRHHSNVCWGAQRNTLTGLTGFCRIAVGTNHRGATGVQKMAQLLKSRALIWKVMG